MFIFYQRLTLALGLLLLMLGYGGYVALADLSRQFFRQEVGPWMSFSMVLMAAGVSLLAAWLVARLLGGGEGEKPDNPPPNQQD
ncbi:MAG: hypothetical protein NZ570_04235 [Candidatus Caldarchaeum sp.]|nr:hypothetical protein [Candidatus Caldarchaeum sp.]MCS7136787.1 hypothetical protein [Candidatus Caldarchaeum sp.]MDW7977287.1 hypothetical protein [Candidatus Caldarchaeum sp.]MDW8360644.1 hypothetical protein [Candidatus Caldarchaeum sp.]